MKQFIEYCTIALIGLIAGFYMGRKTMHLQTRVEYIQGDTIREKVGIPVPYQVEIPAEPLYIYKTDTVLVDNIKTQEIDTTAILNDWISKRDYSQLLFDNKYGTLRLNTSIQYNRLQKVDYSYTPIMKQTIVTNESRWTPYIEVSYSSLNYIGVGAGLFYKNWGLGMRYVTDLNRKGIDIGLKYKF